MTRSSPVHSTAAVAAFNTVMSARAIRSVYQPIVSLGDSEVVGFEALARGPAGTLWANPDALISYAAAIGRLPELDWICRAQACRGALAAGLPPQMPLFVNIEPASSRTRCPGDLAVVLREAAERLLMIAEVTERAVADDPEGLLAVIDELRRHANGIALDDVGAEPSSQALMPLVNPDVIKVDREVIHQPDTAWSTTVVDAVRAQADRTGAVILAEGIETAEHLTAAVKAGATLGQGYLFGRPAPLPRHLDPPRVVIPLLPRT
jgi:EAL domain-containing protein (putative c-di-GMP-specific phosphodiesterase class I)